MKYSRYRFMEKQPGRNRKKGTILLFLAALVPVWLYSQDNPLGLDGNMFQVEQVSPEYTVITPDGRYFFDFGKDAFGTLVLQVRTHTPDTLVIHLGEKAVNRQYVDRNPGGSIRYRKVALPVTPAQTEYRVNLPPDRRNTHAPAVPLPDSFGVVMPFRYCEIEKTGIPLTGIKVYQKIYHYRFDDSASAFSSSDTLLNRIWDLCKYSIKATSFCGIYIDGDRERIPYEADALINQLGHYSVDREYSMARRTNSYFIHHPTWPTEWLLQTVLLFYNDYMYTGDLEPLSTNYQALKYKTLADLERDDGLISSASAKVTPELMHKLGFHDRSEPFRDIVDWPEAERDGYEMEAINTVVNAFHYISLERMAEIAGFLGNKADSVYFSQRCRKVKEAMNSKLLDKTKGIYVDGEGSAHSSLHANMFPLAFGIVPQKYVPSVVSFIRSRGMACSVYGAQYLLEGLYNAGEADYALSLLTATNDRSWWNMIASGSTITMEAWDMKYKPNSDWNHAWGAAPANIITRCLWGIRPAAPGYKKAVIRPRLGGLTSSSIRVPTLQGPLTAVYKLSGGHRQEFVIRVPQGMKAAFFCPDGQGEKIYVNNRRVKPGAVTLLPGTSTVVIR